MCSVVLQLTRDKKDGRGSSLGRGTESTIPWRGDGGTEAARKQARSMEEALELGDETWLLSSCTHSCWGLDGRERTPSDVGASSD